MNVIQEPGVMAVQIPENATDFTVSQPEGIAFSSFEFTYKTEGESHTQTIDSNVEFSNVEVAGRCGDLSNEYLQSWCKRMKVEGESYVILKLKY